MERELCDELMPTQPKVKLPSRVIEGHKLKRGTKKLYHPLSCREIEVRLLCV